MRYQLEILLIAVTVLFVYVYLKISRRMIQENQHMEQQLLESRIFYSRIRDYVDDIRKYRHDLAKHIRIVEHFMETDQEYSQYSEFQDLRKSVDAMHAMYEEAGRIHYCDDPVINAVCEIKKEEWDKNKISSEISVDCGFRIHIKDMDIVGLLHNLLDNAAEASMKLTEDERKIVLNIRQEETRYHILVKNRLSPDTISKLQKEDAAKRRKGTVGRWSSNKEEPGFHGYGTRIISDTVARYHGSLNWSIDNKDLMMIFTCTLLDNEPDFA